MIKNLLKVFVAMLVVASFAMAQSAGKLYGIKGDQGATFMKVLKAMEDKGYVLSDPHEKINDAYKTKYGSTKLDNLGFFSTANDEAIREIMIKFPAIGGFSPFNFHVYKKMSEDMTWYGHLDPYVMADIVGMKDKTLRKKFADSFKDLDALAKSMMKPTTVNKMEFDKLPKRTMMEFTIPVDEDLEDFIDDFQEKWEGAFEDHGYIIAGFKNFKDAYDGEEFPFDAYWVYSLCHFPFSNGIFNDRPDAGVFAPCSIYMYIKPGEKVLHVGMPTLNNWDAIVHFKNPKFKASAAKIEAEIESIYVDELGATKVK